MDAFPLFRSEKNIALFEKHGIYRRNEVDARTEIYIENYCKKIHIEAITMTDMARSMILPAVTTYVNELSQTALNLISLGIKPDNTVLERLTALYKETVKNTFKLEEITQKLDTMPENLQKAEACRDEVIPAMEALRKSADEMELLTAKKYWPFPTYADLLFSEN